MYSNTDSRVLSSADYWSRTGAAVIPLWPNSKLPVCDAWQMVPPPEQWQQADNNFNVGYRCGNGHVVIDADDLDTAGQVETILSSSGLSVPTVQTKRGNHFYLRAEGVPQEFNFANLAIGDGELRARNSYVVAPPHLLCKVGNIVSSTAALRTLLALDLFNGAIFQQRFF